MDQPFLPQRLVSSLREPLYAGLTDCRDISVVGLGIGTKFCYEDLYSIRFSPDGRNRAIRAILAGSTALVTSIFVRDVIPLLARRSFGIEF